MSFARFRKRFIRALTVSWRDQPTRSDVEALRANIARVGLVIRTRWVLVIVLATYSIVAAAAYLSVMSVGELAHLMTLPAVALGIVVIYNSYYSRHYRRFGNLRHWNNVQLGLDALVVTVILYFSGGVESWFWSLYALFILEATLILPDSRDAWMHALYSCLLLGLVEWSEFFGILPHVLIPYSSSLLHTNLVFVAVRYLWQVAVLLGTGWVSTVIVGEFRRELAARQLHALIDEATGTYSRTYFSRACATEGRRARREGRTFHVLLIDVDRFGQFNERFGIDAGDRMLREIARVVTLAVGVSDESATSNVVARFGGEEFAVLLAEDAETGEADDSAEALVVARRMVEAVRDLRVDEAGVTVSIGVAAVRPDDSSCETVLDAADAALSLAVAGGGDRAVLAEQNDDSAASAAEFAAAGDDTGD